MIESNRLYNRDCFEGMKQIESKSIDLVLTDIPYGECSGFVLGGKNHSGLRQINKDNADVVSFSISELVSELSRITRGSIYMFCGTEQVSNIIYEMRKNGLTTRLCIWEKTNPTPMNGQHLWLSSVECCVFGRFPKATFNEFCKGTVWRYPCGKSNEHPTQKPVDLFRYLIRVSSNNGDTILDPFIGSGTTAIAAIQEGRKFIGFEINKDYYDLANKRLRKLTGPFHIYGNIGV